MRKHQWKKWAAALASGSVMLQITGCGEAALGATALFSGVTAGGVLYLIARILGD